MLIEDIPIVILPRQSLTREEFVSRFPRGTVALDGVVRCGPFVDDVTLHANFDHHEGVLRDVTMSTAMQSYFAIKCRFCERRDGKSTIVVNDPDQDTALAAWLLRNWKRFSGVQSHPTIGRLLTLTDRLDVTAGAFPMSLDDQLLRVHSWVFKPYTDARKSGDLARGGEATMRSILLAVFGNLNDLMLGRGGEQELDTRHEILYASPKHGFEIVDEIGGNEARCHLFSLGHLWRGYVSIVARKPDGRIVYTIGKPSAHVDFPVAELYDALNDAEGLTRATGWNGSSIVGGSSRDGSTMPWTQVRDVVETVLDARGNR
jgi:intein/homing endonuclease